MRFLSGKIHFLVHCFFLDVVRNADKCLEQVLRVEELCHDARQWCQDRSKFSGCTAVSVSLPQQADMGFRLCFVLFWLSFMAPSPTMDAKVEQGTVLRFLTHQGKTPIESTSRGVTSL